MESTPPDGMILIRSTPMAFSLRTARRPASGLSTIQSLQCACDSSGSRPLAGSLWPPVGPSGGPATHMRGPSTSPFWMARFRAMTT